MLADVAIAGLLSHIDWLSCGRAALGDAPRAGALNCEFGPRLAKRFGYGSAGGPAGAGEFSRFALDSEFEYFIMGGRNGISLSGAAGLATLPRRRSPALFILRISCSPAAS